ncbi:hypothetical protein HDV02_003065 [Globomyces sp. JEL0801]|nr:hypothetical protein HDV02_003065 [Globomyces sp. JEL0801]
MVTLPQSRFVKPVGSRFVLEGKDYFVYSANYWQAMNLGSSGPKGDRSKLLQDLDFMKSKGINNLRLMASSEGPDTEPFRMTPSLMTSPGVYNEQVLDGLDFALSEISKRGLTAVLCFNNFWHWSGGFSQYVSWITNTSIPYPPSWSAELGDYTDHALGEIEGSKSWESFIEYSKRFYNDPEVAPIAQNMYFAHVKFILNRRNPYTGLLYCDDPSIFSLELCNEPQTPTFEWCNETAKYFKSLAPNHMVTVGLESKFDQLDFNQAHSSEYIDYCTNHIWVQNRGEYDMLDPREENINHAIEWGIEVVGRCNSWALELCKPLVLEVGICLITL